MLPIHGQVNADAVVAEKQALAQLQQPAAVVHHMTAQDLAETSFGKSPAQSLDTIPNWPQFRGPNASGVAASDKPPVHFGPDVNLIWRTPVNPGASSPCIWNDRIFLTTARKDQLETLCLNRLSGQKLWSAQVPAPPVKHMHRSNSPATPTPTTDGRSVYVYLSSYGLLAYDFDGVERWRKPLPAPDNPYGAGSSPVLIGGNLIVNCEDDGPDSCLLAVSPDDGRTIWKVDRRGLSSTYSTPIQWQHHGKNELVHASALQLIALDLKTGERRWFSGGLEFYSHVATPVLGEGMIYVMSFSMGENRDPSFAKFCAQCDKDKDGRISKDEIPEYLGVWFSTYDKDVNGFVTADEWEILYKLSLKSDHGIMAIRPGESGDVSSTHTVWKHRKGIAQMASPLYYQGNVYTVQNGGRVTSFAAETGKIHYQQEKIGASGLYRASPVAANGILYFSSERGTITAVEAGDKLRVIAQNKLDERLNATPAIVDDKIYVRTDKHLWAFGE
jgi:outer membrane protein assembly factor BamB